MYVCMYVCMYALMHACMEGEREGELQMVQLSATMCSCIAVLLISLVSFAAIILCFASKRVFIVVSVYFVMTQSGNFWINPRMYVCMYYDGLFH